MTTNTTINALEKLQQWILESDEWVFGDGKTDVHYIKAIRSAIEKLSPRAEREWTKSI